MQREVIYWKTGDNSDTKLVKSLELGGYPTVPVRDIGELLAEAKKRQPFAIFVNATADKTQIDDRVRALESTKDIFSYPLVFISSSSLRRASSLHRIYKRFIPVHSPCRFDTLALQVQLFFPPSQDANLSSEKAKTREESSRDGETSSDGFGGSLLSKAGNFSSFQDEDLIPQHSQREKLFEVIKEITSYSEWLGLHARRVTFVSSAIANSLSFDNARDNRIRAASLLLNWGLATQLRGNIQHDLSQISSPSDIQAIAEGIQESAHLIKTKLADEQTAEVALGVASMMLHDPISGKSELIEDVQCTLVSEIADRACWSKGFWNPTGAHRAVRTIENPSRFKIREHIVNATTRMLVEAVLKGPAKRDILLPLSEEEGKQNQIETVRPQNKSQLQVEVYNLKPGMRLAQSIKNDKGKTLFPSDTQLDYEAICRLWRLSLLRPLRQSIIINNPLAED